MRAKKIILTLIILVILFELGFVAFQKLKPQEGPLEGIPTAAPTELTEAPTAAPTEEPTEPPTEPPTEAPTEPPQSSFLLTFAGDCTLGSYPDKWLAASSFIQTIGEDYTYPFANVAEFFAGDDFTIINLESVLADEGKAASKRFAFRGPVAYTEIMTSSSVEAVTLANNHTEDYGTEGYASTKTALEDAKITYVEEDKTAVYTTEGGLTIGLYADAFNFSTKDIQNNIASLKDQGVDVIVCAFHWGSEGKYRASGDQQTFAHAAIDAGAHIVYGHHPHVLQPIEEYNGGVIMYSLGNFSFGGSVFPQDYDTAVVQQEVIRDPETGEVSLGQLTIMPCSISSMNGQNNFQPTPLEPGDMYDRVLSKLDGSFDGPNLNVDYSKLDN